MHIVARRSDDLRWRRLGDEQRVGFIEPHHALPEMKQAKPQRSCQHEDQQDARSFTIDIQILVKLPVQWGLRDRTPSSHYKQP